MIAYQGMTKLAREVEERLCALTPGNLLALLNEKRSKGKSSYPVTHASDQYMLIQEVARRWEEAELVKELDKRYTYVPKPDEHEDGVIISPAMRIRRGQAGMTQAEHAAAEVKAPVPNGFTSPKPKPVVARTSSAGKPTQATANATGNAKIQSDSKRGKILAALKAAGAPMAIADLDKQFGEATLPHLKKLEFVKWVTLS